MIGFIYAFATLACWTLAVRNFAVASAIFKPSLVNKFRLLLACIVLYIILITIIGISPKEVFTNISINQYIWFGLSGIIGLAIGDFFAFSAFAIIGPTKTSLLSTFAPAAALIGGVFFLNESLNYIGLIGIGITLLAVIYTVVHKKQTLTIEAKSQLISFGYIAGIMAALTQGLGLVFTKMGFSNDYIYSRKLAHWISENIASQIHHTQVHPVHVTFIRILVGFCVIYIIDLFRQKDFKFISPFIENKKGTVYLCIGTLFGPVLGVSFSISTISHLQVSIAQTIFSMLPITVMLYGSVFKKEPAITKNWIAALVAILGVIVIVWRDSF